MTYWTQEREDRLRELHALGLSFGVIAARLGTTRNAVVGKADRMHLPDRRGKVQCMPQKGRRRKSKPWRHKQAFGLVDKHTPPRLVADGFVPSEDTPIPLEQRKTIQTLVDGDCRWPVGDPQDSGFHFCGAEKVPGLPYCEVHARRAFAPPDQRRRVREISSMPVVMKESENV